MIQRETDSFFSRNISIVLIRSSSSIYEMHECVLIHRTDGSTMGMLITQITQFYCKFGNLHYPRNFQN